VEEGKVICIPNGHVTRGSIGRDRDLLKALETKDNKHTYDN
jgi:hypothetical protein